MSTLFYPFICSLFTWTNIWHNYSVLIWIVLLLREMICLQTFSHLESKHGLTSAILCFLSALKGLVIALWSVSIRMILFDFLSIANFRGVKLNDVVTWLKTAPSFSSAKILKLIIWHYPITFLKIFATFLYNNLLIKWKIIS